MAVIQHRVGLVTVCLLVVAGCGGGTLSLSEYSSEAAGLVETLDSRLDVAAEEYFLEPPSVEGLRSYLAVRVDGYRDAVDGIGAIDPPEQVEQLHETLADILADLLLAEEARAAFADTIESVDGLPSVWEGPESMAVSEAEQRAIVLCDAAQSQFDTTRRREDLADVPRMPSDLKEVVIVALDCP